MTSCRGRIFGSTPTNPTPNTDLDNEMNPLVTDVEAQPSRWRFSFNKLRRRIGQEANHAKENSGEERPPVPTIIAPAADEVYSTPLPVLSMLVLSITMLGEFLCANVSTPFLLFMVKSFGEYKEDAEVAFWTGILVSAFFMTQFLTSLLWATVAEQHGRRTVLVVSLLGSAVTCAAFGTSTSIQQALCIRLLQGIFAGSVGVARGSVAFVTDPTNEGRAYAILGFCWGFGGVAGAIIGGSFERPAAKWPGIFEDIAIFVQYPYLLPCILAAFITFTGSVLACFLGRDGGPRTGAIRLPDKEGEEEDRHPPIPEEESVPPSPFFDDEEAEAQRIGSIRALGRRVSRKLSGLFTRGGTDPSSSANAVSLAANPVSSSSNLASPQPPVALASPGAAQGRQRTFSRTSRANGSAYGYGGGRNRLGSTSTAATWRVRRPSGTPSMLRRGSSSGAYGSAPNPRGSFGGRAMSGGGSFGGRAMSGGESTYGEMNFAQRLLMANENAVTNIADLWVAAAMNVDNEDPFVSDDEEGHTPGDATGMLVGDGEDRIVDVDMDIGSSIGVVSPGRSSVARTPSAAGTPSFSPGGRRTYSGRQSFSNPDGSPTARRFSSTMPAIFAHSGVRTPPAVIDAQQLLLRAHEDDSALSPHRHAIEDDEEEDGVEGGAAAGLGTIHERRSREATTAEADLFEAEFVDAEKAPSLREQLPMMVIVQYGILALHSTTHDQVFMSYLVSDYESGGLNLNAGHFAQLIALMCLAQIAYQFYLYPNMGPPRGRFSHLAMFRIGSLLFIPSYLTVILYRAFATPDDDGNIIVMAALALSTAVRYAGITFAYTAISILLNYMTPPSAVGYANGIAQSIVSLARCFGPVLGGYLWSVSVQDNPAGYPLGFVVCAAVCGLAVVSSYLIR
ncbi:hypothetical protein HGRIS_011756 [Hohenbuehelia grisea]|uniref:Major facilitator superfamily MFS-1 n=1 Tax=Hohenbuehelia grisea TaxID=104357 RepID=A0ABR3JWX4_9AGAR